MHLCDYQNLMKWFQNQCNDGANTMKLGESAFKLCKSYLTCSFLV